MMPRKAYTAVYKTFQFCLAYCIDPFHGNDAQLAEEGSHHRSYLTIYNLGRLCNDPRLCHRNQSPGCVPPTNRPLDMRAIVTDAILTGYDEVATLC